MIELFRETPKIDFIKHWPIAALLSLLLVAATVMGWIERGADKYDIDYAGGYEFVVRLDQGMTAPKFREGLREANPELFENAMVQSFEGSTDYSVRFSSTEEGKVVRQKMKEALEKAFGNRVEITRSDFVGPTLGAELKRKALIAIIIGLVGITAYVTFRFEFAFALGALVALFHDVIIATGAYLWAGHELNGLALAAALTIVGYSVNDTIVIFDKVREEIFKRKDFDLRELLNEANCQMLNRTIITTGLTFFSALALLVFGGGAIQDLSIFLVAGLISGTYSTVFIACPIVYWWDKRRMSRLHAKAAAATAS